MNRIARFFQWLAMTDRRVLDRSHGRAALYQTAMGVTVLLTAILAWMAGSYVTYITFGNVVAALGFGTLYALFIGSIDRLIVGTTNWWMALPRILLAMAIGLTVAVPVELRFFEERIQKQLRAETVQYNQALRDSLHASSVVPALATQISTLRASRDQALDEARAARQKADCEISGTDRPECTGDVGKGTAYWEARRRENVANQRAQDIQQRIDELSHRQDSIRSQVERQYRELKEDPDGGLLARYEALGHIKRESVDARHIAWGFRLFFVLLELTPALVKTMRGKTDYDRILPAAETANAKVEISKINAAANQDIRALKASHANGSASTPGGVQAKASAQHNGEAHVNGSIPNPNIVIP